MKHPSPPRRSPLALVRRLARASLALAASCTPGGIGDPCLPEDEYHPHFAGYALGEVNIESASMQCESRLCLVHRFQGRVSCPFGQTEEDLAAEGTAPERCRVPGTSGTSEGDVVDVPVRAWNVERPPSTAVYCSCRCDGPDRGADYCRCPDGFSCQPLVPDYGLGERQGLVGSYCVKSGDRDTPPPLPADCRAFPEHPSCPEERRNP